MKKTLLSLGLLALIAAACSSVPPSYDVSVLSPELQGAVVCEDVRTRPLPDGRMEVAAFVQNLQPHRLQIQVNCVFKDEKGFPTEGEETPFRTLILTENARESVMFTSFNDKAKFCTIRIRSPR
jgi:uncharacterized protein YcfL